MWMESNMSDFRQRVKRLTGWSDEIVNAIRSEEEAEVYVRAGLREPDGRGVSAA